MSQGLNNDSPSAKRAGPVASLRWWIAGPVFLALPSTTSHATRWEYRASGTKATLGITTEQYSWIVGAFQLAYTIFQPLCGRSYRRHRPEAAAL